MKKFSIFISRLLPALLLCLLFQTTKLSAQQPTPTPPPADPHGQMQMPHAPSTQQPAASQSNDNKAAQEIHKTGEHPPFYDYPFGSPVTGHRSCTLSSRS